ncbi:hypothetical protein RHGRI_009916 [Rhododendron griersonianum]|uniref:DUF1664 domain-containing protein n=1 Tax=Rhododendron griersonianum TaxID=479676 RepID=A0AAV6KGI4_9ERIC|nr:hypothetical protein RHGRI_009916 [Rhododendron griersonianum]
MALQTGVAASKVLILVGGVGAGLAGTIVLRSGRLSDLISQLQELISGVNEAEISPDNYDSALLATQIRHLAQEIRELTTSRPITIYNGNSTSGGSSASYLLPAAALGAMGYCYMWWKARGWSLSDVMFVTKHNMANAVATVSKQLEHVSEALAVSTGVICANVSEAKSDLNQIGYDIDIINQMLSGLEGKIELLDSKQYSIWLMFGCFFIFYSTQDMTNAGLWYLCQFAGGAKDEMNNKLFQDVGAKLTDSSMKYEEQSLKGLQFLTESNEPNAIEKSTINSQKIDVSDIPAKSVSTTKTRIHRSYPVGISWTRDILGPGL